MERRGERDSSCPAARGRQHPKRWVLGQSLGVVGIRVAWQVAVDGLSEEVRQWEPAGAPSGGIAEMSVDQGAQAEALIQFAREQQPGDSYRVYVSNAPTLNPSLLTR